MNAIFTEIYCTISGILWSILKYAGLAVLVIGFLSWLWPYISSVVKFFVFAIPVAIIFILIMTGEIGLAILVLIGSAVIVGALRLIFRFLDNKFGILMTEEEAEMEGYI